MNTSADKALRRLFLTLFLRGRAAVGFTKNTAPKSIWQKLGVILLMYAAIGMFAGFLSSQPVWVLSIYLHGQTLLVLGMFVTASGGEILFNKEESEILLHRPVTPASLLAAKTNVLLVVSLYLAGAINLGGFFFGVYASGTWLFLLAHAISCIEVAVFCAACVVLVYQLCLKWFGREKLEGLMTTAQMLLMIGLMVGSQILPRQMAEMHRTTINPGWWINLLPPAWFAGLDDALAGSHSQTAWILAAIGVFVTATASWFAFGRLAQFYEKGLHSLTEGTNRLEKQRAQRRLLQRLAIMPPFSWFLRGLVERAAFVWLGAYMFRDREIKLRLYPGLAPFLVMPFILGVSFRSLHDVSIAQYIGLGIAGGYIGTVPLMALNILKFSQHWRASEVFQFTPLAGPWAIQRGAQVAVFALLALPMFIVVSVYFVITNGLNGLLMILPGALVSVLYVLVPAAIDSSVPLSKPAEEARGTSRGFVMFVASWVALGLGAIAAIALSTGVFFYFLLVEALLVVVAAWLLDRYTKGIVWEPAK